MDSFSLLAFSIFIHGFTSSFHCIGMCGPLALSVNTHPNKNWSTNIIYNFGRLSSYTFIGAILGLTGSGADQLGKMANIQWLSGIFAGSFLIFIGLKMIFYSNLHFQRFSFPVQKFYHPIYNSIKKEEISPNLGAFFIGSLSALLPCGVLYPAYAIAFSSGTYLGGMILMSLFFLGTFPGLFLFGLSYSFISKKIKPSLIPKFGILVVLLGMLTIFWRVQTTEDEPHCHTPAKTFLK
jgi:uncharacterized protein